MAVSGLLLDVVILVVMANPHSLKNQICLGLSPDGSEAIEIIEGLTFDP